jgi:hypothetical protein
MDSARLPNPVVAPPHSKPWARLVSLRLPALCLALASAAYGQHLADKRIMQGTALGAFLCAAALYTWAGRTITRTQVEAFPHALHIRVERLLWALVFAILAFFSLKNDRFTILGVFPWVLGILLAFAAFPSHTAAGTVGADHSPWARICAALRAGVWRISWPTWGLVGAMLIGAFLRLYRLLEIPADLGWDLPYNYTDIQRILQGQYLVFFPDNYGREGMFFYIAAGVARLSSLSPYSIRVASALIGIAAIPAIYALASECADRETGVYAALLLAANRWHIVLTRSGYRVSLMPLFCILALYGLARGLRRGTWRDWAWCGLFVGLGLWTYKAFTFAALTCVGCALCYVFLSILWPAHPKGVAPNPNMAIRWTNHPRHILAGIGILLLVAAIAAVPMLRFVVDSPQIYVARELLGTRLVNESIQQEQPSRLRLYADNLITSLLMFNYEGDGNSRFGVPWQRQLGFMSGLLFVLAVAAALARFRHGGNAMLLLAVAGLLVPMIVSMLAKEKPNCFRSSGIIGPALVLVAMTLRGLKEEASRGLTVIRAPSFNLGMHDGNDAMHFTRTLKPKLALAFLPLLLVALILGAEVRETYHAYFDDFLQYAPDVMNYSVALELANKIIDFRDGPAYIKVWPYWYDGRAVSEHVGAAGRTWAGELQEIRTDQAPLAGLHGRVLVLLHPQDKASLEALKAAFPRWTTTLDHDPKGEVAFVTFYGEK